MLFIVILSFLVAGILLGLTIYLVVCALTANISLKKSGRITDSNALSKTREKSKLNIPLNIALSIANKAISSTSANGAKLIKGIIIQMKAICFSLAGTLIVCCFYVFAFGTVMYAFNQAATSAATAITTLFNHEDDCPCYVQCTGNIELDSKCTYELLFGEDAYAKFVKNAKLDEYTKNLLNNSDTGKEKNEILSAKVNEYMVAQYKKDLETIKNFRSGDRRDRTKMTDEELQEDLIRLLNDYKVNGKNPNCKCAKLNFAGIKVYCLGEKPYRKEWVFFDDGGIRTGVTYDDDDAEGDTTPGNGKVGHATGKYTIQTGDGLTYYWYHQDNKCGCEHDILRDPYGRLHSVVCGPGPGNMYDRGCSIYSTAMAISCVLDTEITPYEVIKDVLKTDISKRADGKYGFILDGTRGIVNRDYMGMDKTTLANSIMEVYGSMGIKAQAIPISQDSVDDVLNNKGGMVIFSFAGKSDNWSWYPGEGHFMCIRKKDSNGLYYKLDSTADACGKRNRPRDNMDLGLPWDEVKAHIKAEGIAIWREGGDTNTDPGTAPNITFDNWNTDSKTIEIDGLDKTYNIAFVSDLHMMVDDEERNDTWYEKQGGYDKRRQDMGNTDANTLKGLVNALNSQNLDAIVFAGDIIDNYGDKVFTAMDNELKNLTCSNVMWLCADHDYNQDITKGSNEQSQTALNYKGGTSLKTITLGSGEKSITLVGQPKSNDYQHLNNNVTNLSNIINGKANVLYFTHVPIESEINPSGMQQSSTSNRGEVYYYSEGNSRANFKLSKINSYANVLYEASNLRGVFAGHIHPTGYMDVEFKSGVNEKVFKAAKDGYIGLITVKPKGSNSGGGGTKPPVGNKEVLEKLQAHPTYKAKANVLSVIYAVMEPKFGENFAIGLMANILAEGNPGVIEGIDYGSYFKNNPSSRSRVLSCGCKKSGKTTIDYWADSRVPCAAHELAGTTISSKSMVDTMAQIPPQVGGIGIGMVQWSGDRRNGLLSHYNSVCTDYSYSDIIAAEVTMCLKEFEGGDGGYIHSYAGVPASCSGKSAAECAAIICKEYEKPYKMDEAAVTRGNSAAQLYDYLHS